MASEQAARRNELLAHAQAEFVEHGFSGAALDRIVRRSGVSKITAYRQFGGKEGLFQQIGRQICGSPEAALAAVATEGRAPEAVLGDFVRLMLADSAEGAPQALLRLAIFERPRFPEIAQAIYAASLETMSPVTRYMERLMKEGVLAVCDPVEATLHLLATAYQGYAFFLTEPEEADCGRRAARAVDLFLHGLAGRRPA